MPIEIEEIVAAQKAGKHADATEPRAVSAHYDSGSDRVIIELRNGVEIHIPRPMLQGLSEVDPADLNTIEILGQGQSLYWPALDTGFTVPGLVNNVFGTKSWMARLAGSARSEAKAISSRKNGAKGGRPRRSNEAITA